MVPLTYYVLPVLVGGVHVPHGGPTMYHMEGLLCTTWRAYHALICTYRALTMHLRCTVGGVHGVHGGPGQEPAARALRARRRAGGHPVRVRADNQRRSSSSFLSSLFSLKGQILCRALSLSTPEHTSFLCFWRATVCQHPCVNIRVSGAKARVTKVSGDARTFNVLNRAQTF